MGGAWCLWRSLEPAWRGVRPPCRPPPILNGRHLRPRYSVRSMRARSNWLLIGEALAFRAVHDQHRTFRIRHLPGVVAEFKLADVLPKMPLTDVMERTDDAALQQRDK